VRVLSILNIVLLAVLGTALLTPSLAHGCVNLWVSNVSTYLDLFNLSRTTYMGLDFNVTLVLRNYCDYPIYNVTLHSVNATLISGNKTYLKVEPGSFASWNLTLLIPRGAIDIPPENLSVNTSVYFQVSYLARTAKVRYVCSFTSWSSVCAYTNYTLPYENLVTIHTDELANVTLYRNGAVIWSGLLNGSRIVIVNEGALSNYTMVASGNETTSVTLIVSEAPLESFTVNTSTNLSVMRYLVKYVGIKVVSINHTVIENPAYLSPARYLTQLVIFNAKVHIWSLAGNCTGPYSQDCNVTKVTLWSGNLAPFYNVSDISFINEASPLVFINVTIEDDEGNKTFTNIGHITMPKPSSPTTRTHSTVPTGEGPGGVYLYVTAIAIIALFFLSGFLRIERK